MKVVVTGAAGFIGSHLCDRLLQDGHDVWGWDNLLTGRRQNLPADFNLRKLDIRFLAALPKADLIIHCAASYSDPRNWKRDIATNTHGASLVAERAKQWGARIVYFQTVLPPVSSYAISKIAGEHYLRLSGQPLTVFRLAAVYGPRNLSGPIPTFYRKIKAGETCVAVRDTTRDFVFIDDLVARVVRQQESGTVEVRSGTETPIEWLPRLVGDALGVEPKIELCDRSPDDVSAYEMNGAPRIGTPLPEGIARAVAWYEQHGVGETYTHLQLKG